MNTTFDYISSKHTRLLSGYGSTEVGACGAIANFSECSDYTFLGQESCDTKLYIVDDQLNPVKAGESGEIVIDAVDVSNGYLNAPELTNSKFIENSFANKISQKIYKTGDFGELQKNGQIRFQGRINDLTKINGMRISLLEIEAVLYELPGVKKASAVTIGSSPEERRLICFVILVSPVSEKAREKKESYLLRMLEKDLPGCFIPEKLKIIDDIPVNVNGKVDRKALIEML